MKGAHFRGVPAVCQPPQHTFPFIPPMPHWERFLSPFYGCEHSASEQLNDLFQVIQLFRDGPRIQFMSDLEPFVIFSVTRRQRGVKVKSVVGSGDRAGI